MLLISSMWVFRPWPALWVARVWNVACRVELVTMRYSYVVSRVLEAVKSNDPSAPGLSTNSATSSRSSWIGRRMAASFASGALARRTVTLMSRT